MTQTKSATKRDSEPTPRDLVELLVWFVNARISSTAQVERQYMKVTGRTVDTFKEIPPENVDAYRKNDQPRAKRWLLRVLAFDKLTSAERESFQNTIAAVVVAKVSKRPRPTYTRRGFKLEWETTLDGIEFTNAYACALLLSDPALRRRVGICGYEECGEFFFDTRQKGGKQQRYCSPQHSEVGRKRRSRSKPPPEQSQ